MSPSRTVKQEDIKREKDGLDVRADIDRFAREGFESIPADDFERLKWYGIYTQRPKEDGYFMVRIKVPGGRLTGHRLREIGRLTNDYGRGIGDITTRQDIQIHWLRAENLPDLLHRIYDRMGMNQEFSCGDAPRNVIGCPLAGIDREAIVNTAGFALAISEMYRAGGKAFSNLPRKFKTAVGGCRLHCHEPQINDVGLFGVTRKRHNGEEAGLGLVIGGGLRDTPHFAQSLRVFLEPDIELLKTICRGVVTVFRDCEALRHGRLRARLKFHVARVGWSAFRDQLEEQIGFKLEHDDEIVEPEGAEHGDHVGVGEQTDGRRYVGVPIARGRLSGDAMVSLADLAEEFAGAEHAELVATIKQNLIFLNIPPQRVEELCGRLDEMGLPTAAHPLRSQLISCTGIEFCKLAVVETKQRALEILRHLEQTVALDEDVMISVTGCPNSCAQYQIADIGLQGVPVRLNGERSDGFHVFVGGRMGREPQFGRVVIDGDGRKIKVPAVKIHDVIETLLKTYRSEKKDGDRFWTWAERLDISRLAELIAIGTDSSGGAV